MRTSAEARLADGRSVVLRAVPYDDPLARELVGRVQQEYVARYGGPDEAVVDPAEFEPPVGLFIVAEVDGVPAGCGAWRVHEPGVAEVKRVFVDPAFRRAVEADVQRVGSVAEHHRGGAAQDDAARPVGDLAHHPLGLQPEAPLVELLGHRDDAAHRVGHGAQRGEDPPQPAGDGLVVGLRLGHRDAEPAGHLGGDGAVVEDQAQPRGDGRPDLRTAGAVGGRDRHHTRTRHRSSSIRLPRKTAPGRPAYTPYPGTEV